MLRTLYGPLDAPFMTVSIREAEMIKLASNAFHALKISFANELGNLCAEMDIDGRRIMEVFCRDHKLNISPRYLIPGFAFGGSCLPKDLRAVLAAGRERGLDLPVLQAVEASNELQIRRAFRRIEASGARRVGLLGLAFKPGTDDLRESPFVALAEILIGRGYDIAIYDPGLKLESLTGTNKAFIERTIPHIARLIQRDVRDVLDRSDAVVVCYSHPEFEAALADAPGTTETIELTRCLALGPHQDRLPLWLSARSVGAA